MSLREESQELSPREAYAARLQKSLEEYESIFVVHVDNVSSNQMHQIRRELRGDKPDENGETIQAEVHMGKNTRIRRLLKELKASRPEVANLLDFVKGNIGFVFTNSDLKKVRDKILANRVVAPARAGAIAPVDIIVPAGNTGMEPGKTSFFQALGVPTKIARGTIEIVSDVTVVKKDEKVGASEAALLTMLNISPFTYGLTVVQVYDKGDTFPSEVLDIEESTLVANLLAGIRDVASASLALSFPTSASVPHSIVNGYKNLLAASVASDYTFKGSEEIKERIANPEAFAVAAPAAAAEAAPAEEKKVEEEEESEDDMGLGLFD